MKQIPKNTGKYHITQELVGEGCSEQEYDLRRQFYGYLSPGEEPMEGEEEDKLLCTSDMFFTYSKGQYSTDLLLELDLKLNVFNDIHKEIPSQIGKGCIFDLLDDDYHKNY